MGDSGKGTGKDGVTNKSVGNDVYVGSPGSAPVWEINLGGDGFNDDGDRGI